MAHSYTSSLFHCVFSTKGRRRLITPALQSRLWPFMGGIARENGMKAVAIGGVEDHVHLLLSLPSTLAIAKAIQLVKSQTDRTIAYINSQADHHRKRTFQEEMLAILKKHGIQYDERYLWD